MTQAGSAGAIVWLRQDLRLRDNPALRAAAKLGGPIVPVYILCDAEEREFPPGGAARWWLHRSLAALGAELSSRGSQLSLLRGPALECLREVAARTGARAVFWNRRYEPAAVARDIEVKTQLRAADLVAESFNGALLREPWEIQNGTGHPYRVFTAFKRRVLEDLDPPAPLRMPTRWQAPRVWPESLPLAELQLLPDIAWYDTMARTWQPGESGAHARLRSFTRKPLDTYATTRDRPDQDGTSALSPHLHFGEISARQIWHALRGARAKVRGSVFASELLWREFAHHLLYHFPHTALQPLDRRFERFEWSGAASQVQAWQRGRTGIPIVDAGMRQLWATGWMHNRVRMIVASFLVKNLRIHWLEGARWFWDTLVDADLAANTLNWQWVAGCGADAAPYFRIFNPQTQSEKFDPQGDYLRRWVPELARLHAPHVHAPHAAPAAALEAAGVRIGVNYPAPIVDLAESRRAALAAYQAI
ncbi:MAG TPA: deoxyribodipyrimidine photo-lyase [Steroidobacteraceae bacterium]|jgi:deoxyribodipyrimidine photo-lyase